MRLRLGLRSRLLALVLIAALPIFLFILHLGWVQRNLGRRATLDVVEMAAWRLQGQLVSTRQLLVALAQLPAIRDLDQESSEAVLTRVLRESPGFVNLGLLDKDGWQVASALSHKSAIRQNDSAFFKRAVETRGFAIGEYTTGRISGLQVFHLGHPVMDDAGGIAGVIYASLDVRAMGRLTEDLVLPSAASVMLLDRRWTVLASWPEQAYPIGRNLMDRLLRPWIESKGTSFTGHDTDGSWLWTVVPVTQPDGAISAYACIRLDASSAWSNASRSVLRNFLLTTLSVVIMLFLASSAANRLILSHVRDLSETARRLAAGDWSTRTTRRSSTRELADMASSFDEMAASLQRQHEEILQANVSLEQRAVELQAANRELQEYAIISAHDLQEPLRKIQAFGENLESRHADKLDLEVREQVQRMAEAAHRMSRLVEDLLSYSQISVQPFHPVELDLAGVCQTIVMELRPRLEEINATVEIGQTPLVEGDLVLMRRLLVQLFENAIKYRSPERPLRIRIEGRTVSSMEGKELVEVGFEDNGIGFDERYLGFLFQLFHRLNPKNRYEGTGVGLAMCRKILEKHGGFIQARSQPGQGAVFFLRLPPVQ